MRRPAILRRTLYDRADHRAGRSKTRCGYEEKQTIVKILDLSLKVCTAYNSIRVPRTPMSQSPAQVIMKLGDYSTSH